MLETKGIALMIFTVLNVLGVGFLLYVLVQFWKEGHKSGEANRLRSRLSGYGVKPRVFVVSLPLTPESRLEDGRVIQFPVRGGDGQQHGDANDLPGRTRESSRSAAR
jgi:hypothetical protein